MTIHRNINDAGLELIQHFEGCKLAAYKCPAGKWTIGYGSTRDVYEGKVITQVEAGERLRRDLWDAEGAVSRLVTADLTDNEFAALVSLCFNIGAGNFGNSTLLRLLNTEQVDRVPHEFLRWDHGGGKLQPGLHFRRLAESELFQRA